MKPQTFFSAILALVLVLTSTGTVFAGKPLASDAVSTAFTYQGHLRQSGELYNGTCDMQFSLYNALSAGDQVGSTLTQNGVAVVDGLLPFRLISEAACLSMVSVGCRSP